MTGNDIRYSGQVTNFTADRLQISSHYSTDIQRFLFIFQKYKFHHRHYPQHTVAPPLATTHFSALQTECFSLSSQKIFRITPAGFRRHD